MADVLKIARIVGVNAGIINGAVDLKLSQPATDVIHFEYGDYIMNVLKSKVEGNVRIVPTEEIKNPDNSLTIKMSVEYRDFKRTHVAGGANCYTVRIHIYASQNRQNEVFFFDDNACGTTKDMQGPSFELTVNIPPRQTVHAGFGRFYNQITSEQHPKEDEFNGGFSIHNPLRAGYTPGMQYHDRMWVSHDRIGGKATYIASAGRQVEMWTRGGEQNATGDPPSFKTASGWRNMKKIGMYAQPS